MAHERPPHDSDSKDLGTLSDFVKLPNDKPVGTTRTGEWFVEFHSRPTASGGKQVQLQRDRSKFTQEARAADLPSDVTHIYTRLFNGVTVAADEAQATQLLDLRAVKSVYPVLGMRAPAAPPSPDASATKASLAMIGADKAQAELGFTGAGIKVGVIDSGIDYNHPDLGGSGDPESSTFPTARVGYGWDFIGDDYTPWPDENGEFLEPSPDADPMDCMGHGTCWAWLPRSSSAPIRSSPVPAIPPWPSSSKPWSAPPSTAWTWST